MLFDSLDLYGRINSTVLAHGFSAYIIRYRRKEKHTQREKKTMNKKLAQMVLAAQRDIATTGNAHSYTLETVSMLIIEYWHRTPRADEAHDLVAAWRLEHDFASAVALASWLLAQ